MGGQGLVQIRDGQGWQLEGHVQGLVQIRDGQVWHTGIGRYEILADIAHNGKTDISASVSITADMQYQ